MNVENNQNNCEIKYKFCFNCVALNKEQFVIKYLFLSIIMYAISFNNAISVIFLIITVYVLINFNKNKNYNDEFLKCYSIMKLVFSIINLFGVVYIIILSPNFIPFILVSFWLLDLSYKFYIIINKTNHNINQQINQNVQEYNANNAQNQQQFNQNIPQNNIPQQNIHQNNIPQQQFNQNNIPQQQINQNIPQNNIPQQQINQNIPQNNIPQQQFNQNIPQNNTPQQQFNQNIPPQQQINQNNKISNNNGNEFGIEVDNNFKTLNNEENKETDII